MTIEASPVSTGNVERARNYLDRLLADRERAACFGLVAFAVFFNLVFLLPELTSRPPDLNDNVFHYLNLQRADDAIRAFDDPTDPWLSQIGLGFPVFHYYQHFPYVLPALLHAVTFLPLEGLFHAINYLLLCAFPVSIFWSMRRFGFDLPEAALASLVSSLVSTDGLFGFDLNSYVWSGYGLYTQLWGMLLLPPALALSYRVALDGRGYFWAVVLLSATILSHLAFGYIAFGSMTLFVFLSPSRREVRVRGLRMLGLLGLVASVTSYFLVPLALDSGYLNRSVWDPQYKYDSYGAQQVLEWLIRGELFDHGRLPVLTTLGALGLLACSWRRREERYRLVAALFALWLVLYFGPATWGGVLDGLPLSRDFYFHRLIAGVHVAGIFVIGIALAVPWRWAWRAEDKRSLAAFAVVGVAALLPAYFERGDYLRDNRTYMQQTNAAFDAERGDITNLVALLKSAPPGRVYAGLAAQWGGQYRIGAVPVHAILTAEGIDNIGFLWHPWSMNGDIQVSFDETRPEQYDLFNIRYVVAPDNRRFPEFVRPIGHFGRHWLYEVETTGYFDIVTSDRAYPATKSSFYAAASNWFASAAPALRLHPTLVFPGQDDPPGLPVGAPLQVSQYPSRAPGAPRPTYGTIQAETIVENGYQAVVELSQPALVLLKATYHPGWHAYVDGKEVTPRMVTPSYMAVPVEAGTHGIGFEYRPGRHRHLLQLVGLFVLAGFVVDPEHWRRWLGTAAELRRRARL